MAAETANAASKIWCSEAPALKFLVKAFVTIGATITRAPAEESGHLAGPVKIPQERHFPFSIPEVYPDRSAEAHEQAAARETAKELMEKSQDNVEKCIQSLKEKQSMSMLTSFLLEG
jgi:hypothetical protein